MIRRRLGQLYYRWVTFYYGKWTLYHDDHRKVPKTKMHLPPGSYKDIEIYKQVLVYHVRYSRPWVRDKKVVMYRISAETTESTPTRLKNATAEPVYLPTFSNWDRINPLAPQLMMWAYLDIILLRLRSMPL